MKKLKFLLIALVSLVLGACNTAILAGSAANIGYTLTNNPDQFGGIKTVLAESQEVALIKLKGQKIYNFYPVSI